MLEILWEQESVPDATDRLLAVYEMLFKGTLPNQPARMHVDNHFDKKPSSDDHAPCS